MEVALKLAQIINALGTIIIGAVVAWIACQQFRLSRMSFQSSTYDRRRKVFSALQDVLFRIQQDGEPSEDMLNKLLEPWVESMFLFPSEIPDYLKSVRKNILEDTKLRRRLFGPTQIPPGPKHDTAEQKFQELQEWFDDQIEQSRELFKQHMTLA